MTNLQFLEAVKKAGNSYEVALKYFACKASYLKFYQALPSGIKAEIYKIDSKS